MNSPVLAVDTSSFRTLLEEHYPLRVRSLHPLVWADDKRVWWVNLLNGAPIIVRAYARPDAAAVVRAQGALLPALATRRFPAERLVPARDGSPTVVADRWTLLATTALAGRPTSYTPAELHALGAQLGRLHALDPADLDPDHAIGAAAMLPAREIDWVSGELARVAGRLDAGQQARYAWLTAALVALDRCDGLPDVIIHNDCHPGNALTAPDGEVALNDWEGAGRGPAIIDLGFLLASCHLPITPLPPDPLRVEAVVAGYRQQRQPASSELDRLAAAIRFRALIFGAAAFAARPEDDEASAGTWWRSRYDAADEIARRARELFGA